MAEQMIYQNEYDLTRALALAHDIVEWDQSTIINDTYSYIMLDGTASRLGRDRELVVNRSFSEGAHVYRVRSRSRATREPSKRELLISITSAGVSTVVQ